MENTDEIVYSLSTVSNALINGVRGLSEEEFNKFSKAITDLEKFHNEESLYNLIELNFNDLNLKINFYLNQYINGAKLDFSNFSFQFIDLNRLILNLLSSIRTYLDHTETRLKRNFGESSDEYKFFKKLTAECFDNNFAYRFLSKLRNYSQHCGLPTGSLSISDRAEGKYLNLYLLRDDLLNDFSSWGTIVKPDLENQDEKFDLLPLLRLKAELLKDVNTKLNAILLTKLTTQGSQLLELIKECQNFGHGVPSLLKISGDVDSPALELKWFPLHVISNVMGIEISVI